MKTVLLDEERQCRVRYFPEFLDEEEIDDLFSLLQNSPREPETYNFSGQTIITKRQSHAYGDPGLAYKYSGQIKQADSWPHYLLQVKKKVEEATGSKFNFVLCNFYSDGLTGLGWHSDDEKDLVPNAPIASISLGAIRDFQLRPKGGGKITEVELEAGSLLLMEGATQKFYQHQVPKRVFSDSLRINLTFRLMKVK